MSTQKSTKSGVDAPEPPSFGERYAVCHASATY